MDPDLSSGCVVEIIVREKSYFMNKCLNVRSILEPHLGLKLSLGTLLTLVSALLNGPGDLLSKNQKKVTHLMMLLVDDTNQNISQISCVTECTTFHFLFGEGRAIRCAGFPLRANVGRSILPFSNSQQGRTIVDKRLPAVLPEVNNVLCGVLLQVGKPAQTQGGFQKF